MRDAERGTMHAIVGEQAPVSSTVSLGDRRAFESVVAYLYGDSSSQRARCGKRSCKLKETTTTAKRTSLNPVGSVSAEGKCCLFFFIVLFIKRERRDIFLSVGVISFSPY